MLKLFGALGTGAIIIQILNYFFIKYGSNSQDVMLSNFKLVIMTLPLQIMASMAFVYFYSSGVKLNISYFYLSLMSVGFSMILSWLVAILILNGRMPTGIELLACILTVTGIGLFIYAKQFN